MPRFIQQIEQEEGRSKKAYPDPLTHGEPYTIGVGHTGGVKKDCVADDILIDAWRDADCYKAAYEVWENFPWIVRLNQPRRAVMFSMCFQMGIGVTPVLGLNVKGSGLKGFPKFLAAVENGKFDLAETEMLDSVWARQTPLRAKRHARQMSSGEWES